MDARAPPAEAPRCSLEYLRLIKADRFRRNLTAVRAKHRAAAAARGKDKPMKPAIMVCERWFMRSQLREAMAAKGGLAEWRDPVFPMGASATQLCVARGGADARNRTPASYHTAPSAQALR